MSRKLLPIVVVAALILMSGNALACSCVGRPGTVAEEYLWADTVFLGTVQSVALPAGWNNLLVEIQVERSWKAYPAPVVLVVTGLSSAECGVEFRVGDSWVVFGTDTVYEGVTGYFTHICTLTTPEEFAGAIMAELDVVPVQDRTWGGVKAIYR
jgi:hypothetical protein